MLMSAANIQLIECPRDAMQGWKHFIPTEKKAAYLNSLLKVGFHTLDFGSFVSPKAIPQMADTKEVISLLDIGASKTNLLAIVANLRGAEEAVEYNVVTDLGFPFSVSETFQQRNTNSSIDASLKTVEAIQRLCEDRKKNLVVYLSMAFGNPYGDLYSEQILIEWGRKIADLGVRVISLADTVGVASPSLVSSVTTVAVNTLPGVTVGVHLHSSPLRRKAKIEAAYNAGCRRFDGALKGIGGCPMADDELVGNMNTELMINYFNELKLLPLLNEEALMESMKMADEIFESK
jgi:hydroxymethylglutaryl-CoA lyase